MPFRKKQSQSLIDQASDALVAARPVIENAVATVVEGARDLSKDAAAGATVMAKETKTKAAPLIADGKVLAGEIADATREVAIPKAKTAAAAGAASAVGLAASGKEYAAAKVADVKGEPPKRKGSKFRKRSSGAASRPPQASSTRSCVPSRRPTTGSRRTPRPRRPARRALPPAPPRVRRPAGGPPRPRRRLRRAARDRRPDGQAGGRGRCR